MEIECYFKTLPVFIIQEMSKYLDTFHLVNLMKTCKYNSYAIDCDYIWKYKIKSDFPEKIKNIHKNPKKKYIIFFKTLCFVCKKKTFVHNDFFRCQICKSCEQTNPKYKVISFSRAKKEYFLNNKDLHEIRYINRGKNIKLFLKSDIEDLKNKKYSKKEYSDLKMKCIKKKIAKSLCAFNRFHLLNNVLLSVYNISLESMVRYVLPELNYYTDGCYNKFLSGNKRASMFYFIIEKCLELDFIYSNGILDWRHFFNFEDLLLKVMLTQSHIIPTENLSKYITSKISEVVISNKMLFYRKKIVIQEFLKLKGFSYIDNIELFLADNYIKEFVYHGRDFYDSIKKYNIYDEYDYIYGKKTDTDYKGIAKRLCIFYSLEKYVLRDNLALISNENFIQGGNFSPNRNTRLNISSKKLYRYIFLLRKKISNGILVPKFLLENFIV